MMTTWLILFTGPLTSRRSSPKARKGLRPSNPTRLSRLRNRQVENLLIPRVHGLRGATQMPEAIIVGAVRTPIGKRAGSLKDWRPDDLAAFVLRALADRTGIEPKIVEDVVLGCVTQVDEQGLNIARLAPLVAGFPESVPGTSVNRMCASGLQAFNFAAMEVMTGQNDVVIAGGVEVMSRVPLGSDAGALSPKLLEKYEIVQQGISADLVADKYKITREQMDEFSLWSHRKAIRAIDEGRFKKEIEPALVDRPDGLAVGPEGELVHLLPRDLVLVRDEVGGDPLLHDLVFLEQLRAERSGVGAQGDAGHHLDPARDDDVVLTRHDLHGGEVECLQSGGAHPVHAGPGNRLREPRDKRREAGDVQSLFVDLGDAAQHDVLDDLRLDPGAVRERPKDERGQVVGPPVFQ